MGDCVSKFGLKQNKSGVDYTAVISIKKGDSGNSNLTPKLQAQFDTQIPNRRQKRYWNDKIRVICKGNLMQISQENFSKFFQYMGLSQTNLRKMYALFKKEQIILDHYSFIQSMKKIAKSNQDQLASFIQTIYFHDNQKSYLLFQNQMKAFLKPPISQNIGSSSKPPSQANNSTSRLNKLSSLMNQRRSVDDKYSIQRWLKKNIDFTKFRSFVIEGDIKQDQKLAYKCFRIDFSPQLSRLGSLNIDNNQKEVLVINWRWCEKMLNYMDLKYQIQDAPFLKKRVSQDLQSKKMFVSKMSRKDSLGQKRNSQQLKYLHKMSMRQDTMNFVDISNKKVLQKTPEFTHQFTNHPGQIQNNVLIGNFQWELKRNIRKNIDYITIKQQTFQRLCLVFGGGPKIKRKIVKGYTELRPYFILYYIFRVSETNRQAVLIPKQVLNISSTDTLSKTLKLKRSQIVLYHKNIGGQWQTFPPTGTDLDNTKIIDYLSQSSFLVELTPALEAEFRNNYIQKSKSPNLGQVYTSKTYRIQDSSEQRTLNDYPIQVCIMNDHKATKSVQFVVLNWSHHIQRTISKAQFLNHFKLKKNYLQLQNKLKKDRAGISNLGNTCYMSSVIQALLSTVKEEYISKPKGELGVELLYIVKKITQRKKVVFPVDFKTKFDKYFNDFKGQDQQDAHQFCIRLFEQFQTDNKQLISQILNLKLINVTKCFSCQQKQIQSDTGFIVSLPLRDFAKKQVKIDYIRDNNTLTTITFTVQQNATIQDWRTNFEKASGARNYYLCQVQNGKIRRTFNRQDKLQAVKYSELNIQNNLLIIAYELNQYRYDLKLDKHFQFCVFRNLKGKYNIVRVQSRGAQSPNKNQNPTQHNSSINYTQKVKVKIKEQGSTQLIPATLTQKQLLRFPQDYPQKQMYIKIINYDDTYNQIIGKPFIFKLFGHYPIKAIRLALEECLGTQARGCSLRLTSPGQLGRCQICRNVGYNEINSKCFRIKENNAPICWAEGVLQFVLGWQDGREYDSFIKKVRLNPKNQGNSIKNQQFDNFQMAFKQFSKKQQIQLIQCDKCKKKNVMAERHAQIATWPKVLILHLQRFTVKFINNNFQASKVHTNWKIQQILIIDGKKYLLKAIICHVGTSVNYGHYITFSNGYCYDDQLVTMRGYDTIPPESVYMLFYHQQ